MQQHSEKPSKKEDFPEFIPTKGPPVEPSGQRGKQHNRDRGRGRGGRGRGQNLVFLPVEDSREEEKIQPKFIRKPKYENANDFYYNPNQHSMSTMDDEVDARGWGRKKHQNQGKKNVANLGSTGKFIGDGVEQHGVKPIEKISYT